MNRSDINFLFLNVDNQWPQFEWEGLELGPDGSLRLFSLPLLEVELPSHLQPLDGPAGITSDSYGTIYFSDPAANKIFRMMEAGEPHPVNCLANGQPAQFNSPRGLWVSAPKHQLFVADSGNHRIQIFDLDSFRLSATLGSINQITAPQPSSGVGFFNSPIGLSGDAEGNIYVLDSGNQRIQKFDSDGNVIADFWNTMQSADLLVQPSGIAVGEIGTTTCLYITDSNAQKIFVFDADGYPLSDDKGNSLSFGAPHLQVPAGIAVTYDTVYVGDNISRRVLAFKKIRGKFVFAGEAVGYTGPVAGLTLDGKSNLWVYCGKALEGEIILVPLSLNRVHQRKGSLWSSKPISVDSAKVSWHRLRAKILLSGPGCHLQFFLHTSDKDTDQPHVYPGNDNPFRDTWQPMPADLGDFFIGGKPASDLWIGAYFVGDGRDTPQLSQLRIDFDHESYLRYLPAIYGDSRDSNDFLVRFLSLLESFINEIDAEITNLSTYFDSGAARKEILPWLAGWLGLPLRGEFVRRSAESDVEYEARKMQWNWDFLRAAMPLIPYRGTLPGLEALLRAWLKGELVEALPPPLILTDLVPLYTDVRTIFQLAPKKEEAGVPGETYAQVGVTTVLGEGLPFFFIVDLILDPQVRELHHSLGIEILERTARFLLDIEKPAHSAYDLRLRAQALTMQLTPEKDIDRRPGEIYAQVGETTLLWGGL